MGWLIIMILQIYYLLKITLFDCQGIKATLALTGINLDIMIDWLFVHIFKSYFKYFIKILYVILTRFKKTGLPALD